MDNITLPASLTYVGDKIFRGYVNTVYVEMTEAEMNALNENWKAGIGENAVIIYLPIVEANFNLSLINNSTEYKVTARNKGMTVAKIPRYYKGLPVSEISDSGFTDCDSLVTVNIPDTVKRIGNNAFANCDGLVTINIPDSVISIGSNAFRLCNNLASITGMRAVQYMGSGVFTDCPELDNIVLPATLTYVGNAILRNYVNTVYVEMTEAEMNALNPNWLNGMGEGAIIVYGDRNTSYCVRYFATAGGNIVGKAEQNVWHGYNAESVTAVPDEGYEFLEWSDGVTSMSRAETNVTCDLNVAAIFAKKKLSVEFKAGAGGRIDGNAEQTVRFGENAEPVVAVPDEGYEFVDWSDGITTAERVIINVTSDIIVTARFKKLTFNVVYTAMGGGRVEGNAEQAVEYGDSGSTVTAVPDFGYEFAAWSDGLSAAARCEKDVKADFTVSAIFKKIDEITVVYTATDGGYIKGDALQTVAWGGNCSTVVAEPVNAGYVFIGWSDGVETPERQDAGVTADGSLLVLEAIFEIYSDPNDDFMIFTLTEDKTGYAVRVKDRYAEKFDIPAYYNGLPVVEIQDNAFVSCANLTTVKIPETVIRIGNNAFMSCKLLTEVSVTDSIRIIGSNAFAMCASLRSFTGMSAVEELGDKAFALCPELDNITLPATLTYVGDRVLRGYVNTVYVEMTEEEMNFLNENWIADIGENAKVYYLGNFAFSLNSDKTGYNVSASSRNRDAISKCIIPSYYKGLPVVEIINNAFMSCKKLATADIPNTIVRIGSGAFMGCEALTEIHIPDSVKIIGANAFAGCFDLKRVTGMTKVEELGNDVFALCAKLSEITLPSTLTAVGNGFMDVTLTVYVEKTEAEMNALNAEWKYRIGENATIIYKEQSQSDL